MSIEQQTRIYKKLLSIQTELKTPKEQFNKFGGFNYRSSEDILQAVKPLCEKYDVLIETTCELLPINNDVYIKVNATAIDIDDKTTYTVSAYAREEREKKGMDSSQITGACISYAKKYALGCLLAIDNEKDSDATNTAQQTKQQTKNTQQLITDEQIVALKELGVNETLLKKMAKYYKVDNVNQITFQQAEDVIARKREINKKRGTKNEKN